MWMRFTEGARKVVFYAQEEAGRLGESYVATEHLLLGLMRESDSVATRILDCMGVSLRTIRREIERQVTRSDVRLGQDMQLTPRAKRVIDLAYDEARRLNNNYIGTEHLLLGLIREGDGMAAKTLGKLNITLEQARQELRDLTGGKQAPASLQAASEENEPPFAFPDGIAKLFVPRELYDAVHELAEVQRELGILPKTNQYERAYELQTRHYELQEKIDKLVEAERERKRKNRDARRSEMD